MANPALVRMLGYTSFEELAERNLEEEGFEADCPRSHFKQRIEADGRIVGLESAWRRRDGTTLFVRESTQVIRDDAGNTSFYQGTVEDITERKRAEIELCEYQTKLKAMASEILQTEERERQRLAVGLHDDICQKLVLTKLAIESSLRSISDATLADSLKNAAETIGETIGQAESLTFELSNPVLREFGFVTAIEKFLATEIRDKHGIDYELEADESMSSLRDEVKTCLFRVTRELLTNVVKHARARKVKMSIRKDRGEIFITVQDDGIGFKSTKVKSEDSTNMRFGLFSVREQLEHLGGVLIVESTPGRGTVATVVI